MKKTYENKDFQSGDITVKITLGTTNNYKDFPVMKDGKMNTKRVKYRSLDIKHSVTTTLKQTDKIDDKYVGEYKLTKDDDGNFIEVPVEDPQLNMFEE